jgi:hypothetical protein
MLGKLSWAAIPFNQPIPLAAGGVVLVVIIGVLAFVTLKGWLPYLWREWITSVDHKRIGIMYILLGMVMLLRGFSDAIMMRSQQALAFQSPGYLPPEHYEVGVRRRAARFLPSSRTLRLLASTRLTSPISSTSTRRRYASIFAKS